MSPTPPLAPLPDKLLLNDQIQAEFWLDDDSPENSFPTHAVINLYKHDQVAIFMQTGIGTWMRPNDPGLSVRDALRQVVESHTIFGERSISARLYAQTDKLIDMFGTRDPVELKRRINAYLAPSPTEPTAGDGAAATADTVTS